MKLCERIGECRVALLHRCRDDGGAGIRDLDVHATAVRLIGDSYDVTARGQGVDGVRHRRCAHPLALSQLAHGEAAVGAKAGEHGELRVTQAVDGALAAQPPGEAESGKTQISGGRVEKVIRFSHYLGSLTKFSESGLGSGGRMDAVNIALELAVQDPAGVRIAREVGAVRVELTQALALGGLTPSPATLELAREAAGEDGPEIHVLVRPRAGGFHYDADEIAVSVRDVQRAVAAGADGVVVGALDASGMLDLDAMARLRDAAGAAVVTLHRAIDVAADPVATLESAIALGLRRVLTSGGASTAIDAIETLRSLVAVAKGRIEVMAGSGVSAATALALAETGVDALHFSAKRTILGDSAVRMGSAADGVGGYEVTDRKAAFAMRDALGF